MPIRRRSVATAALALLPALLLSACSKSSTPAPTLSSIALSPLTLSLVEGATHAALTVTGTSSDGTMAAITAGITWTSSAAAIAAVDATGAITAGSTAGSATITASVAGPSGALTAAAAITVTAPPVTLASITLSSSTLSLVEGASASALTVTGHYSDSSTAAITTGITWSSSASTIAAVSSAGVVTAGTSAGTATITASVAGPSGALTATVAVTVTAPPVTLEGITSTSTISLDTGASSAAIVVTAHYSDTSSAVVTTGVTFASGNTAIATVNSAGVVTAGSTPGTTSITATYMGDNATTAVTVTAAPVSYPIIDFNTALGAGYAYGTDPFGGAISSVVSTGVPAGALTSGPQFAQVTIPAAGSPACYAGTTLLEGYNDSVGTIPFSMTNTKITVELYVPAAAVGNVVDVKVEDAADATKSVETRVTLASSGWQTLTFDMSSQAPGTAALNTTYTYNKISIFPDFTCVNNAAEPTQDEVFYVGAITFPGASAPSSPPLLAPPPPAAPTTAPTEPTLAASSVIYLLSSYFTAHGGTVHAVDSWSASWGANVAVTAPVIAGDQLEEFAFSEANGYDGILFGDGEAGGSTANTVNATGKTALHLDVWFSTSSSFFVKLVDNAAVGGAAEVTGSYTVPAASIPAQTWVPLEITFAELGMGTSIANLQQMVLQPTDAATNVYVDNLYFH